MITKPEARAHTGAARARRRSGAPTTRARPGRSRRVGSALASIRSPSAFGEVAYEISAAAVRRRAQFSLNPASHNMRSSDASRDRVIQHRVCGTHMQHFAIGSCDGAIAPDTSAQSGPWSSSGLVPWVPTLSPGNRRRASKAAMITASARESIGIFAQGFHLPAWLPASAAAPPASMRAASVTLTVEEGMTAVSAPSGLRAREAGARLFQESTRDRCGAATLLRNCGFGKGRRPKYHPGE